MKHFSIILLIAFFSLSLIVCSSSQVKPANKKVEVSNCNCCEENTGCIYVGKKKAIVSVDSLKKALKILKGQQVK
jgi:hypothetical protein